MEKILNGLFHSVGGFKPQIIIGRKNKIAIAWYPGNKEKDEIIPEKYFNNDFLIGFTGLQFEEYSIPQHSQPCSLSWIGFDLDQKDNKKELKTKWIEILHNFPEFWIRSSTSGNGIHL